MPKYDVFLSHNSTDKPAVEELARRLAEHAGLNPFLDKWHLIPGEPWMEAVEEALQDSATVAVFIGPSGVSPWHNEEMRSALDSAVRTRDEYRVIPVLLPGASAESVTGFLSRRTWVDFRSGLDDVQAFERLVAGIKGQAIAGEAYSLPDEPAPYRGLLRFEAEHARFFFGREADRQRLVDKLERHAFVAVVGASGSGKSSLVRAGLLPSLAEQALPGSQTWHNLILTPGSGPLRALAEQLATLLPPADRLQMADDLTDRLRERSDGLRTAVTALLADRPQPLLLVVDQFEELFTLCQEGSERCRLQADRFIANLADAVDRGAGRIRVLITLRADFLDRCLAFPTLRDLLEDQQVLLGPLDQDALREVIVRPAQAVGALFEKGLVNTILRDLEAEPGVLPLLQHALYELWLARRGPWLTLDAYEASGGVSGALRRRAQATYTALTPEGQEIARNIFLRLTALGEGVSDTRRRVSRAELYPVDVDLTQVDTVLQALSGPHARLIVADEESVEVAHETLIQQWDTLRAWLEADREALRIHRHLTQSAQEWESLGRDPGELYRGARLAQAEEWFEDHADDLNVLERAFLTASLKERERAAQEREAQRQHELETARKLAEAEAQRAMEAEAREEEQRQAAATLRRRNVGLVVFGIVGVVLALTAGVFGVQSARNAREASTAREVAEAERERAEVQANLALSRQLAAQAENASAKNPELAMLLALEAQRAAQTDEATNARAKLPYIYPPIETRLQGHTKRVSDVAWSPDGSQLASKSEDGDVILWDGETGQPTVLRDPALDTASNAASLAIAQLTFARGLAWSPNGAQLASTSIEDTVVIWDEHNGQAFATLTSPGPVSSLAWHPDGSRLAAASGDGTVAIWDVATIPPTDYTPGSQLKRLWLERLGTPLNQPSFTLAGHSGSVESVAWSPDGSYLASASDDETVIIWEMGTSEPLVTLRGHTDRVMSVAWSPDGRSLATASVDDTILIWDVATHQPIATLRGHTSDVYSVAWHPDGTQLASASGDDAIITWDVATGQPTNVLGGHTRGVWSVAWHPDGTQLASGAGDSSVVVWDTTIGPPATTLESPSSVSSTAWSPDGSQVASGAEDGTVTVWDISTLIRTGVYSGHPTTLEGHTDPVRDVAWSPDGSLLASASEDNTVIVWDLPSGRSVPLQGHGDQVWQVAWSPDGSQLASASFDKTVMVWDVAILLETDATDVQPVILGSHTAGVQDVAWSPDGSWLASASWDETVKVWDVSTLHEPGTTDGQPATLDGHSGWVRWVAWSPDGSQLASASDDGTIIVWDASTLFDTGVTGVQSTTLAGYNGGDVIWSPDGSQLASPSRDGTVAVWDISTWPGAGTTSVQSTTLQGRGTRAWRVAWSPDGRLLASGEYDGTISVWDVTTLFDTGATISQSIPLQGHSDTVTSIAWSPDGSLLASASQDGTIHLLKARFVRPPCQLLSRNLTPSEWEQFMKDRPYHATCPDLPADEGK